MNENFLIFVKILWFFLTGTESTNEFEKTLRLLHSEPPVQAIHLFLRSTIQTNWIEQKLDHFHTAEERTWQMRFKSNDYYFKNGGPIFIIVGAEWEITDRLLAGGHTVKMAQELNGYLFYTEHRYYGQSHPTSDLSLESLKYLKMEQSLADLAHFIKTIKARDELKNSKVFLVGGSLGGSMVVWFRRIYPGLSDGSWSSSAPVQTTVNFYQYNEIVAEDLQDNGGSQCYDRVQQIFKKFTDGIKNGDNNMINGVLQVCSGFNPSDKLDVWTLFVSLINAFAGIFQFHEYKSKYPCSYIMDGYSDSQTIAQLIRSNLSIYCIPGSYSSVVEYLRTSVSWDRSPFVRQWIYQKCSQLGWYTTTDSKNQPFGNNIPLEYFITLCQDVYGHQFNAENLQKETDEFNEKFRGLNPDEHIYYTHGSYDPWRVMGVQGNASHVKVVPGYSHCADLAERANDSAEMIALRTNITKTIKEWIRGGSK